MLRAAATILLAGMAAIAIAQPASNQTDSKGRKQGAWSKAWPNGQVRYAGNFVDDRPVGEFRHYDEKGRLATVQRHAGDGKVSRAEHFHPNGTLMGKGRYIGQEKDSTWNYYAEDGSLRKVERYQGGKLNGTQITYYPNGQMAESEERKDGLLNGANKSWFPNGSIKSEATYVGGEAQGAMVFYYPDGKKEIEGQMVNGDRDGSWRYFNKDGSLQLVVLYAKGVMLKERKENGTFTEHFDDERPKSEVTYKKGRREGKFIEWHDNGQWLLKPRKADPEMGIPEDMERVIEGQSKKREGTYVNDLLEGEVKEYDEKGRLLKVTMYVAGVEQQRP